MHEVPGEEAEQRGVAGAPASLQAASDEKQSGRAGRQEENERGGHAREQIGREGLGETPGLRPCPTEYKISYMMLPGKERAALELLVERGESYGLELVASSRGALKRGTVYVVLQRLAAKRLVTSRLAAAEAGEGGPPRRIYRATPRGAKVLRAHAVLARLLPAEAQ